MRKSILTALLCVGALTQTAATQADSTLEFAVQQGQADQLHNQPVLIRNGRVMIKGAGGDANFDVLYTREQQNLLLIDHRERSIMTVDERQLDHLARRAEDFQPLLQGLGAQLAQLSPQQRGKWEEMLGGKVDLDRLAESAHGTQPLRVVKSGAGKQVAGIDCEAMNVLEGKTPRAQFCLADAHRLNLSTDDYATVRSLLGFSERMAVKTRSIASQLGLKIPAFAIGQLEGVPIEAHDLSKNQLGALTLSRFSSETLADDLLQAPNGYRSKALDFFR